MELLRDVWECVTAVFEHWHGWVSGGIFALVLEVGDQLWNWKPSKKLYYAAMSFLYST